jgi:hypothetical protein
MPGVLLVSDFMFPSFPFLLGKERKGITLGKERKGKERKGKEDYNMGKERKGGQNYYDVSKNTKIAPRPHQV